jgi:ABC-type multidrug transport system fused ATPase/permease subunit
MSCFTGSANIIDDEERAIGQVDWRIYWAYCTKVLAGSHVIALIIIQTCWQGLQIASDFWLAQSTSAQESFVPSRFISVYAELAMGSGAFVLMRSLLVAFVGLKTAQHFFLDMIRSVFRAPMSFFDATPTGRILSRVRIPPAISVYISSIKIA